VAEVATSNQDRTISLKGCSALLKLIIITQDSSVGIVPKLQAGELRNRGFASRQGPLPVTCHEDS